MHSGTELKSGAEVKSGTDMKGGTEVKGSAVGKGVGGAGGGDRLRAAAGEIIEARALVIATAPGVAAQLLGPLDSTLGEELAAIPSSPIAVVATGFATESLPQPLDGFGFLVPRSEGLRILGCLWDSSIFRFRAPVGRVLMRCMIGGAHDPDVVRLAPSDLLAIVRRELAQVLGITAEPDLVRVIQHRQGIPQYPIGHDDRLGRIQARLTRLPGIHLTGWGYRGIAVNRVIEDAVAVAREVAEGMAKERAAGGVGGRGAAGAAAAGGALGNALGDAAGSRAAGGVAGSR
jgi:oxygen-dependent protoporphyrinogen oxidase